MSSETRRRNTNSSERDDVIALVGEQEEEVTSDDEVDENAAINLQGSEETLTKKVPSQRKCLPEYVLVSCLPYIHTRFTT